MHSRQARIAAIVVAVIVVIAAGAAAYVFLGGEDPVAQVSSPWPVADSERSVPKPEEPPIWPLTGLPAPSAETPASIRVVSVKIENSPAARPQSGIQSADVVYESITEGGITRFNCMFHSTNPDEPVGPVRSARLSDIDIVPQYSALFVFSGASGVVNSAVRSAGLENLSQDVGVSTGYKRVSFKSAPHNLYLDLAVIREEAERRGFPTTQPIKPLAFERASAAATPTVSHVTIPFSTANTSEWTYDPPTDAYLRENNGREHTDSLTGEQISAKNVVVIWARMVPQSKRDVSGSTTYDIELTGSGQATIFRNGEKLDCTWTATADAPPTFKAVDGTAVRLAPGNTWFQVVPTSVNISLE
jgi:hypothetical protein